MNNRVEIFERPLMNSLQDTALGKLTFGEQTMVETMSSVGDDLTVCSRPDIVVDGLDRHWNELSSLSQCSHLDSSRTVVQECKDTLSAVQQLVEFNCKKAVLFGDDCARPGLTPFFDPLPGLLHLLFNDADEVEEGELARDFGIEL